jgi:hypothetical protein
MYQAFSLQIKDGPAVIGKLRCERKTHARERAPAREQPLPDLNIGNRIRSIGK